MPSSVGRATIGAWPSYPLTRVATTSSRCCTAGPIADPVPLAGGPGRRGDRGLGEARRTRSPRPISTSSGPGLVHRDDERRSCAGRGPGCRSAAGRYFVTRNDGSQNQDVWYVADILEELLRGGRVLVDPNTFSEDGTDSLPSFTVSPDGLVAYGLSEGGSDWDTFVLLDLASGEPVDDAGIQTKFSEPTGCRTAARTSTPTSPTRGSRRHPDAALAGPQLRLHRLGQPPGRRRADPGVPRRTTS